MNLQTFLGAIAKKSPPAPESEVLALEHELGCSLPEDYRAFLVACNGGYVGGALWFTGPTPTGDRADAGIHHIGGLRQEAHFSLHKARAVYAGLIPNDLLWIMDDPFGNAICLGLRGAARGQVFFWDHEYEVDDEWDGSLEGSDNVQLIARSFSAFVAGLTPSDDA